MSVVRVDCTYRSRGHTAELSGRVVYRETWEVITDSLADDGDTIQADPRIPTMGNAHRKNPRAIVTEWEASQSEDNPYMWLVSIVYDSQADLKNALDPNTGQAMEPSEVPTNPLLQPPTWKITFTNTNEPATEWRLLADGGQLKGAGNLASVAKLLGNKVLSPGMVPIRNSALLPFDPPLMVEVMRPVIRYTRNVPSVSMAYLTALEGAVNDRPWKGAAKWTAKIGGVEASNKRESGIAFVELTIDIALKRETWLPTILDCGLYEYEPGVKGPSGGGLVFAAQNENGRGNRWKRIADAWGHVASDPQPLDGNGKRLKPDAEPVYLCGLPRALHEADFGKLLAGL